MGQVFGGFHTATSDVYHNNEACSAAADIPSEERIPGRGGKQICAECKRLNGPRRPPRHVFGGPPKG